MAWQRPSCIVQALQSARQTTHLSFRSSAFPLSPISTPFLLRPQKSARSYTTDISQETSAGTPFEPLPETPEAQGVSEGSGAQAAPPINFEKFLSRPARLVPESAAYFSGTPKFIDHLLKMEGLLARYASLPILDHTEAPQTSFLKLSQFYDVVGESVPMKKYKQLIKVLARLNQIQPAVFPDEVKVAMQAYIRPGNPYSKPPDPPTVDKFGRARGRGKRKASSAVVYLVEGEGEVMVNGKTLLEAFPRLHDRESATWPLRCIQRLDKYNVWATVRGGGTTGQAEAITLAVARALMVHEPALKPTLRKAGAITVDPRRVERKKPGHVKARKMPAWVKR